MTRYRWITYGDSCGGCRAREGQIREETAWDTLGWPPLHNHCDCDVEELDASDPARNKENVAPPTSHSKNITQSKYTPNNKGQATSPGTATNANTGKTSTATRTAPPPVQNLNGKISASPKAPKPVIPKPKPPASNSGGGGWRSYYL